MLFRKKYLIIIIFFFLPILIFSQHVSLMKYNGELGGGMGTTTFIGQVGGEIKLYRANFNFYYKKFLTDRFGVRVNYEFLPLGGNDSLSKNQEVLKRGFRFYRTFHEFSFFLEYFFEDVKYLNSKNHLIPYVGIGMGYLLNEPTNDDNFSYYSTIQEINQSQFWPICTIPINLGLSYRFVNDFNIFSEFTFRFTTSDFIDNFGSQTPIVAKNGTFFANNYGHDKVCSIKLGISNSLFKIFGPDRNRKQKFYR